jgi:hypothetical protein
VSDRFDPGGWGRTREFDPVPPRPKFMKTPAIDLEAPGEPTAECAEFRRRIAENDALIRSARLDNGGEIVSLRTRIYTDLIRRWAVEQRDALGYARPFAVVSLGGTGREEVTPCSDRDIGLLFEDDDLDTDPFLLELVRQTRDTTEFRDRFGFSLDLQPRSFGDMTELKEKDLNTFLDMAPILDPQGLADRFRDRIRETVDQFEHFLHVTSQWRRQWESGGKSAEGIRRFDLKNDGLRLFQGGVWTLGGEEFVHSHEIYRRLVAAEPRDLAAYHFLLRVRCWIQLRRPTRGPATALGNHEEDVMTFEDFESLGAWLGPEADERDRFEFGDEVRERLISARRRVIAFARGVIEDALRRGRRIQPDSPIRLGAGGLTHDALEAGATDVDRSHAALTLLHMAQRYELRIDPSELLGTFRNAGDWLLPVPALGGLFRETRGSLADTFEFLSQIPGAEDRLFPGYGKFETSIDERVRKQQTTLRGPLEREKMRWLEGQWREGVRKCDQARLDAEAKRDADHGLADVGYAIEHAMEAGLLPEDWLVAIKLAIKTKRLPLTPDDLAARNDPDRPLQERFSSGFSGVALAEYYPLHFGGAGFGERVLELTRFLIEQRRTIREIANSDLIDDVQVSRLVKSCDGDLERLRALFVFTHADRHAWKSQGELPTLWYKILELYAKARMPETKRLDPDGILRSAGFDDEAVAVLKDFGRHFYEGIYRHRAVQLGAYLVRLKSGSAVKPRVTTYRDRGAEILAVAARDDQGMAAAIAGALWRSGVTVQAAHLFSAANHRLALDFFHLDPVRPGSDPAVPVGPELSRLVEKAITDRLHIDRADEVNLPDVPCRLSLTEYRPGLYLLQATTSEDIGAVIYVLCYKAYRYLRADVHAVATHCGDEVSAVSVYLSLPKRLSLEEARGIVARWG